MSKNLDELGLKSIFSEYDLFFIDIWGVVHNGIKLYENAVKVLNELSYNEKKFVLLTNAPRPNLTVINTLKDMRDYMFPIKKFFNKNITSVEQLQNFIQERSAHVTQTTLFGYLKTRIGTRYQMMFEDEEFSKSINIAHKCPDFPGPGRVKG